MRVAPWHRPRERYIGGGVYVTNIYADHYLAALIYAAWRWIRRLSAAVPESSDQ